MVSRKCAGVQAAGHEGVVRSEHAPGAVQEPIFWDIPRKRAACYVYTMTKLVALDDLKALPVADRLQLLEVEGTGSGESFSSTSTAIQWRRANAFDYTTDARCARD